MTGIQLASWTVLAGVLALIGSGRVKPEMAACGGLLLLGVSGLAPPSDLFGGFGNPALVSIAGVLVMSEAIASSGTLTGLGAKIQARFSKLRSQILALAVVTAILSAFMNNVGALGLTIPTALKMARRARADARVFGLPLAFASIIGGTVTLAGTGPNMIISALRASAVGKPYRMFDYTPHGLAIVLTAGVIWALCGVCGLYHVGVGHEGTSEQVAAGSGEVGLFRTTARRRTVMVVLGALVFASTGILPPSLAFSSAALLLVVTGVIPLQEAFASLDMGVLLFVGSMLGIASVLERNGAIGSLARALYDLTSGLEAFWLVLFVFLCSALLSNVLNNAAAAVVMGPLVLRLANVNATVDALLMAVAAGSSCTLLLPTHQSAIITMNRIGFKPSSFIKLGAVLTPVAAISASLVIVWLWN